MAIIRNITIDQGSTYLGEVSLTKDDKSAFDLSSFTAFSSMKKSPTSSTSYLFTVNIIDAVNGILQISMTDEQTSSLKVGRYMYDVVIESGSGQRFRVIEGIVDVTPGITL